MYFANDASFLVIFLFLPPEVDECSPEPELLSVFFCDEAMICSPKWVPASAEKTERGNMIHVRSRRGGKSTVLAAMTTIPKANVSIASKWIFIFQRSFDSELFVFASFDISSLLFELVILF